MSRGKNKKHDQTLAWRMDSPKKNKERKISSFQDSERRGQDQESGKQPPDLVNESKRERRGSMTVRSAVYVNEWGWR
jgi:hypothetical protein